MKYLLIVCSLIVLAIVGWLIFNNLSSKSQPVKNQPAPTEAPLQSLKPEDYPKVKLTFSVDAHYVTVDIANLKAASLEYNLIYDAKVKGNQIQTGVNASEKLKGESIYSKKQLLGSESSGKFTYHQNITNASMELTLRDSSNRSIFSNVYPFTVTAGKSVDLQASQ